MERLLQPNCSLELCNADHLVDMQAHLRMQRDSASRVALHGWVPSSVRYLAVE